MCAAGSSLRLIEAALESDDQRTLLLLEFALRFVSAMEQEAETRRQPLKKYMQELRLVLMGEAAPKRDRFNWLLDNS
jgi:hypothetical protein